MPPRASSADKSLSTSAPSPEQIAAAISEFLAEHPETVVREDGKTLFDMRTAKHALRTDHGACTLQLWSDERNLARQVVAATPRGSSLRLATERLGHAQTKMLELAAKPERRSINSREGARRQYLRLLERALGRRYPDWQPDGFRTAMDLERSFGPAYARGSLLPSGAAGASAGRDAWAVIGVAAGETQAVIDGVLTLGVLWLHTCREQSGGRRLYRGLRVVVPRGAGDLTLSRLAWMSPAAAEWELLELDERSEEFAERDPADHGNLRTRLVHHLDEAAAAERFRDAIGQVRELLPPGEEARVEQRLLSAGELVFALHGFVFARVRLGLAPNSFAHTLEITVGAGAAKAALTPANREELRELIAELFERRRGQGKLRHRPRLDMNFSRRIGPPTAAPAHGRMQSRFGRAAAGSPAGSTQDPLYRAAPERWLESVLRADLAPLTRGLGPVLPIPGPSSGQARAAGYANDPDPDTLGNRADAREVSSSRSGVAGGPTPASRVIPRLDPRHIYTQVPAIAGAGDRGMLDLLGVTVDGRLAVIELKAGDDLQLALQGLDYWIRVRHHHAQTADPASGLGELQRHGYFTDVPLSPLPPRLYLVAPALHVHPATETVLRYLSPRVEWTLLALDERWREQVRVVWRKWGGAPVA